MIIKLKEGGQIIAPIPQPFQVSRSFMANKLAILVLPRELVSKILALSKASISLNNSFLEGVVFFLLSVSIFFSYEISKQKGAFKR